MTALVVLAIAVMSSTQQPQSVQALYERAINDFLSGRITESAAGFDEVARRDPRSAPELWQRGIALYYAGRYKDCRAQFESHRTVNPNDVENAAWHFLCVTRAESVAKARAAILPVGPDSRTPMREVYEMFKGALAPEEVLAAAGGNPTAQFYANLYLGLYFDALGDTTRARQYISVAAQDRFAPAGGYMHAVARIHLGMLQR